MTRPTHVVLAAGGTAGHIEPALNLADALMVLEPDIQITVIGGEHGLESTLVPARGYQLRSVAAVAMPRKLSRDLLTVGPRVRRATKQSKQILREVDADVVVGFGGYAALPAYLATRKSTCGLVIHEANAKPGLANKLAARFADQVFVSVPGSLPGTTLGLPLRASIADLNREALRVQAREFFGLRLDAPVLLVFGGSQGAQHINAVIAQSLPALLDQGIQVLHGYGPKNEAPSPRQGYVAVSYFDRMELAYAAADLGLTRAGAMTVAEVSAVGLPTIFVPLPIGNGEQKLNAINIVNAGGAVVIDNAALNAEWLTQTVGSLVKDGVRLNAMSQAAARAGVKDSGLRLAKEVLLVAHRHRSMKLLDEGDYS
jgi:UDP-N-acetylglucosamine--N-acetylmuramyl-(pentapeptide) pyrophosphoryl-undecaprenol N-acetylglucosamine transferase